MRTALGMGLVWVGYSLGLYGYTLLRGYNITVVAMLHPTYTGSWPPQLAGNTVIIPDGTTASQTTEAGWGSATATSGQQATAIQQANPNSAINKAH